MLERFAKTDAEGTPPALPGFVWDKLAGDIE
jgi:hypothetical protein